jgi:hypothetical protein
VVLGRIFEPALDPQQMDLGLDAEIAEPVLCQKVLQHATIDLVLGDGRVVLAEL